MGTERSSSSETIKKKELIDEEEELRLDAPAHFHFENFLISHIIDFTVTTVRMMMILPKPSHSFI